MMRHPALWAAAASLLPTLAAAEPSLQFSSQTRDGEVVLSDWPLCDYFVVLTDNGLSLVLWEDGLWVFTEGDDVYGTVNRAGRQRLNLVGGVTAGEVTVKVLEAGLDLWRARKVFHGHCDLPGSPQSALPVSSVSEAS